MTTTASLNSDNVSPPTGCTELAPRLALPTNDNQLWPLAGVGAALGGTYFLIRRYKSAWIKAIKDSSVYPWLVRRATIPVVLSAGAIIIGVYLIGRRRVWNSLGSGEPPTTFKLDDDLDRLPEMFHGGQTQRKASPSSEWENGDDGTPLTWKRWQGGHKNSLSPFQIEREVARKIKDCRRMGLWQREDSDRNLAINVLAQIPYRLPNDALRKEALIQLNEVLLAQPPGVGVKAKTLCTTEGLLYNVLRDNPPQEVQELASQAYRLTLESLWAGPGVHGDSQRARKILRRSRDLRDRLSEHYSSNSRFHLRIAASLASYLHTNPIDLIGEMANQAQDLSSLSLGGLNEFAQLVKEGKRLGEMTDEEQFKTWFAFLLVARRSNFEDRQNTGRILGTLRTFFQREEDERLDSVFACTQPEHWAIPYGVVDLLSEIINHLGVSAEQRKSALSLLLEMTASEDNLTAMRALPLYRPQQLLQMQHLVPHAHPLRAWLQSYSPPMCYAQRSIPSLERQWKRMFRCNTGFPARLPFFTGREAELQILEDRLRGVEGAPLVVLQGPKTIGKSALTDELLLRHTKDIDYVYRFSARSLPALLNGIQELYKTTSGKATPCPTDDALLEWLRAHVSNLRGSGYQVLMIVEDIEHAAPDLMKTLGKLIAEPRSIPWLFHTSHTKAAETLRRSGASSLPLEYLSGVEEGISLFNRAFTSSIESRPALDAEEVEKIVNAVGLVPARIVQSAACAAQHDIETFDEFTALGSRPLYEDLEEYGSNVVDAYRRYLRNLDDQPAVRHVLLVIVLLDPTRFHRNDIKRIVRRLRVRTRLDRQSGRWEVRRARTSMTISQEELNRVIRVLQDYYLCKSMGEGYYQMNTVVQEAVIANLQDIDVKRLFTVGWLFHPRLSQIIQVRRSEVYSSRDLRLPSSCQLEPERLREWHSHLDEHWEDYLGENGFTRYREARTRILDNSGTEKMVVSEYLHLEMSRGQLTLQELETAAYDSCDRLEAKAQKRRLKRVLESTRELLLDASDILVNERIPLVNELTCGTPPKTVICATILVVALFIVPMKQLSAIHNTFVAGSLDSDNLRDLDTSLQALNQEIKIIIDHRGRAALRRKGAPVKPAVRTLVDS